MSKSTDCNCRPDVILLLGKEPARSFGDEPWVHADMVVNVEERDRDNDNSIAIVHI